MFFSPFSFVLCYVAPALPADRQFFTFEEDVQFYVLATALVLPRILAMFQLTTLRYGFRCDENSF